MEGREAGRWGGGSLPCIAEDVNAVGDRGEEGGGELGASNRGCGCKEAREGLGLVTVAACECL